MIQQCLDLLTGRAFVPDPLDAAMPLARRFSNRPLVAVTLFKDGLEAVAVTFREGVPSFGPPESLPSSGIDDADANFLRAFAERNRASHCLVVLTTGYTAVLSSRTRRPENDEDAVRWMRDSPERLLGEPPAQGCRPTVAFHPTHNFAVVLNHREHEIAAAVSLASRAGLGLARLQCGMSSLLIHVLGNFWADVEQEAEILLVDRGSLFYLPVSAGGMGRPLFDIGLKEAPLRQAIAERVEKLKPGGKVILVDTSGLDVLSLIGRRAEIRVVTPLKDQPQPSLWACCSDAPRLGADLYPSERTIRPCAPARLRVVTVAFWGVAAVSAVMIGGNAFRASRDNHLAAGFRYQAQMLAAGRGRVEQTMNDAASRGRQASAIRQWLLISPSTQALLIELTREIEAATEQGASQNRGVAQVDSISLARQEGQPQMRLALVVLGDASAANRVFQRISALLARLGYSTVDLKESLVPQGFRYEHLLNMPNPDPT